MSGQRPRRILDRMQTRLINPVVRRILRTPWHDLISRWIVLLTVTGRRSGATILVPTQYSQDGQRLTLVSKRSRAWWRNLESGVPLRLTLQGVERSGRADVSYDPEQVQAALLAIGRALGRDEPIMPVEEAAAVAAPGRAGPLLQAAAIVAAGTVEGAVLGLAQAYALRAALPALSTLAWVRATAGGAAAAWLIGCLPIVAGDRFTRWPPVLLVLLGVMLLTSMGVLQWRVLRRQVSGAAWWVAATAGAWLVALGGFTAITTPLWQEGQPGWLVALIGVLGGMVMAVTVAALTGLAVLRFLRGTHRTRLGDGGM